MNSRARSPTAPKQTEVNEVAKTNQEIEQYNYFTCPECDKDEVTRLTAAEFQKHLVENHNIKSTSGTRSMMMHVDGSKWYSHLYEWAIEGKKFHQHIKAIRHHRFG